MIPLQAGEHPVQTLLVSRGYVIAFLLLCSMVYIRYETRQRFKEWVYAAFGFAIAILFLFSTGTIWFAYPAPGVIWSIAFTLCGFFAGAAVMWVFIGPEDIFVRHDRELQYEADETDTDTDTDSREP